MAPNSIYQECMEGCKVLAITRYSKGRKSGTVLYEVIALRALAMKKRLYEEKQKLSQLHLITTSQELTEELLKIDMKNMSATRNRSLKMDILKTQVRIRKEVLGQTVPIIRIPLCKIITGPKDL